MKVTDTLSQVALQNNTSKISDNEINYFVHFVMSSLPISEKTHQKLLTLRPYHQHLPLMLWDKMIK